MENQNNLAADAAAKWQYKQAVVVAVIAAIATLTPTVLKIVADTNTITQLRAQVGNEHPGLTTPAGLYEWEWNEGGFAVLGSVDVSSDGSAQITLEQWMRCESENKNKRVRIADQRGAGTIKQISDSRDISVNLPVQFIRYNSNCVKTGMDPELSIIRGRIKPVAAYSGTVDYASSGRGHFPGGMTLVKLIDAAQ